MLNILGHRLSPSVSRTFGGYREGGQSIRRRLAFVFEMQPESFFRHHFDVNDDSKRVECLRAFDRRNSGQLDENDFAFFVKSLLGSQNMATEPLSREIFAEFDRNGDGKIDESEFESVWNELVKPLVKPVAALIVVDVQNDFIDGTLAMKDCPAGQEGSRVVPVINHLIENTPFDTIAYSIDYHPDNHISFYDNLGMYTLGDQHRDKRDEISMFDSVVFEGSTSLQKLWPRHCVEKTWGSQFHNDLIIADDPVIIKKGTDSCVDSYSAFFDNSGLGKTALDDELKKRGVTHVFVCGLALDYCVGCTILDSLQLNYPTVLVRDATMGTDKKSMVEMETKIQLKSGVISASNEVLNLVKGVEIRPEFVRILLSKYKNLNDKNLNCS